MSKPDEQRESIPYGVENLKQHLAETRLRLALLQYQQRQDEAWRSAQEALPPQAPEKQEEARFFARTEANTLRLIRKHTRHQAKSVKQEGFPRLLQAAAVFVLVLALGFGTALAASPALRVQVMRLLYSVTPEYTEVRFVPDPNPSINVPDGWTGLYFPAFIPQEYRLLEVVLTTNISKVIYEASEGRHLSFSEHSIETESNINTEDFTVEEVDINGDPGLIAFQDGYTTLTWAGTEKSYILSITENTDIALAIAKSIIKIK